MFTKILSIYIVMVLGTADAYANLGDRSETTCAANLAALNSGRIHFVTTGFRTEVAEQHADYCIDMATIGHIESLLHHEFNPDWFAIKVLEKDFYTALTAALQSPPNVTFEQELASMSEGETVPDSTKKFVNGDAFGFHGYTLADEVGLVDKHDFALTPEFIQRAEELRKQLGLRRSDPSNSASIPPLLTLTTALENVLSQFEEFQKNEKDPAKLAGKIEGTFKWARQIFDLALSGFHGSYSPLDHYHSLLQQKFPKGFISSQIEGIGFHERSLIVETDFGYPDRTELQKTIKSTIDRGYNLQVIYSHDPQFIDSRTGRISLPSNFNRKVFKAQQSHETIGNRHAALIEGYHINESGQMDWVLIKNSGGNVYDSGYNEMSFQYLVEMGFAVSHHTLPERALGLGD